MKNFLLATLLSLGLALDATGQSGSKIVFSADATGQTGAMQTGSRASAVTFTFCGTGFSGPVYVDAAATQAALAQVWTTTMASNSDCTTTYAYSPASKWYRVRWTRTAGVLNVWMNIHTGDVTPGALTGPVGGFTAGQVPVAGSATGLVGDDLTYNRTTDTLTARTVSSLNLTAAGYATPGAITVANVGTPGVVTVTYKLVWKAPDGSTTEAGAASSTATSNATLSATNFNRLSWAAGPAGATAVVYRTVAPTSPATTGIVYTGTALTVDDVALAGGGETAPTVNGTGVVTGRGVLATGTTVNVGTGTATARVGGVIHVSTTAQATTGTVEEVLATYTMPANTLAENGKGIRITAAGLAAANANAKAIRVRVGGLAGTIVASHVGSSPNGTGYRMVADVYRTGASAEVFAGAAQWGFSPALNVVGTAAVSTAATIDVVVTATTVTAAGDATNLLFTVEALN